MQSKSLPMSSNSVHDNSDPVLKVIRKMDRLTEGATGVRIESLYETKVDIDNKVKALSYAPISEGVKKSLYKKAEETGKYINDMLKVIAAYGLRMNQKNQIEHGTYGVEPTNLRDVDGRKEPGYKMKRVNKEQLEADIQKYKHAMGVLAKKIIVSESSLEKELVKYEKFYKAAKPLNENMTKGEKIVIAALMVGFALPILYFFSQTSPDGLVVGNFAAGDSSPVLAIMMTSVAIFVGFFLTHHKLK